VTPWYRNPNILAGVIAGTVIGFLALQIITIVFLVRMVRRNQLLHDELETVRLLKKQAVHDDDDDMLESSL